MNGRPRHQALFLGLEAVVGVGSVALLIILMSQLRGTEFLGQYVIVTTWVALFRMLSAFGAPFLLLRELGKHPDRQGRILAAGLLICLSTSILAALLMTAVVPVFHYSQELQAALLFAATIQVPLTIGSVCKSAYIARRRAEKYVGIKIIETFSVLAFSSYFVVGGHGVIYLVGTLLCANVLSAALLLLGLHRLVRPIEWRILRDDIRGLVGPLLSFSAIDVSAKLFWRADIVMLSKMTTVGITGLYMPSAKVLEVFAMVPTIFSQILFPAFARDIAKGTLRKEDVESSVGKLFYLVTPMGIGTFLFAEPLITMLFGEPFREATPALRIFMVTYMLLVSDMVMSILYEAAGYQRNQMYIAGGTVVLNVLLNLALIPPLSFLGAALATLISTAVSWIIHWHVVSRSVISLRWARILARPIALGLISACPAVLLWDQMPFSLVALSYVLLYTALVYGFARVNGGAKLGQ